MKTVKNIFVLSILSIVGFSSCTTGDDGIDTEKPVVILNAPIEGARLEAGKDIHFDMELSDNEALGSYKVDIHGSFDGHEHGGDNHAHSIAVLHDDHDDHDHDEENEARKAFKYQHVWDDIFGLRNAHVHHHEIVIPADAKRGSYHFMVQVLDKAGNQTMVFRNIEIVGPGEADGGHDHDHDHEDGDHDHNH